MHRAVQAVLESRRERYNSLFALLRHGHRRVTAEAFGDLLQRRVLPLAEAAARIDGDGLEKVMDALYETALDLLAHGILGPVGRGPVVDELWGDPLIRLMHWILRSPRELLASLSNAVWTLSLEREALARSWMDELLRLAPRCSSSRTLLDLGQVLAWRLGMAHWRETALDAWDRLPDDLAMDCLLGTEDRGETSRGRVARALRHDRWWVPGSAVEEGPRLLFVGRLGGFEGFGGAFLTPPELLVSAGRIHAFDDFCCFGIHGDGYGLLLRRLGGDLPDAEEPTATRFSVETVGEISWGEQTLSVPDLPPVSSHVELGNVLAVSSKESHWIWLFAVAGAPS